MFGFVLSLGLVVGVIHLPFGNELDSIGWYVSRSSERLSVDVVEVPTPRTTRIGAPITRFDEENESNDRSPNDGDVEEEELPGPAPRERTTDVRRLTGRKVLDFAQKMPEIVGGIGAYYIQIDYPDAAVAAGIEGRLVLSFVVDTVGHTNDIEVIQSLHPACDSAAVQALRQTQFVPGRQNGELVPVRMRLPVRFQLIPREGSGVKVDA